MGSELVAIAWPTGGRCHQDVRSFVQEIDDGQNFVQTPDEPESGPFAAPRVLIVSSGERVAAGRVEHRVLAAHRVERARFGGKRESTGRDQTWD
jgi:hypothetical protein